MIISTTTKSIEINTITTDLIAWAVSYDNFTATGVNPNGNDGTINTVTDTAIVPVPAASEQNELKLLIIENLASVAVTVAIRINTGVTRRKIFEVKLSVGENLQYTKTAGFYTYTSEGAIKQYATSASFENFVAANKQKITFLKTAARTTVAATSFSVFDLAGNPGAGILAGTSTANGVVPTDATAGTPLINAFTAATGYIGSIQFTNTVAGRMTLYDMLFKAGAYGFATGTTALSAQPSYASRIPSTSNYNDTEIWIEVTTAFATGTAWQVQATYTNQSGVAGRSCIVSTAQAAASLTLAKMFQLGLQSGDTGIQKLESVIVTNGGTAMTAGAFNVLVLRRLAQARVNIANGIDKQGLSDAGMPQIFSDSALFLKVDADSTSTGVPEVFFDIIG
jgi:hypothetical protein